MSKYNRNYLNISRTKNENKFVSARHRICASAFLSPHHSPLWIPYPHSNLRYFIFIQLRQQWSTWSFVFEVTRSRSQSSECSQLLLLCLLSAPNVFFMIMSQARDEGLAQCPTIVNEERFEPYTANRSNSLITPPCSTSRQFENFKFATQLAESHLRKAS